MWPFGKGQFDAKTTSDRDLQSQGLQPNTVSSITFKYVLGSNDLDSARASGNRKTTIVRCHHQFFLHSVTPDQRCCEMQSIEGTEWSGERLRGPCQDRPLQKDQIRAIKKKDVPAIQRTKQAPLGQFARQEA